MAQCNIQNLMDDARCFAGLNSGFLAAIQIQLWCDTTESLISPNPALQSVDDLQWYRFDILQIGPGMAIPNIQQVPVAPGVNPYLVLVNLDDGLKYKFQFFGTPPDVFWQIDDTPTLEPETPTTLFAGVNQYALNIVTDGGLTIQLTPV